MKNSRMRPLPSSELSPQSLTELLVREEGTQRPLEHSYSPGDEHRAEAESDNKLPSYQSGALVSAYYTKPNNNRYNNLQRFYFAHSRHKNNLLILFSPHHCYTFTQSTLH